MWLRQDQSDYQQFANSTHFREECSEDDLKAGNASPRSQKQDKLAKSKFVKGQAKVSLESITKPSLLIQVKQKCLRSSIEQSATNFLLQQSNSIGLIFRSNKIIQNNQAYIRQEELQAKITAFGTENSEEERDQRIRPKDNANHNFYWNKKIKSRRESQNQRNVICFVKRKVQSKLDKPPCKITNLHIKSPSYQEIISNSFLTQHRQYRRERSRQPNKSKYNSHIYSQLIQHQNQFRSGSKCNVSLKIKRLENRQIKTQSNTVPLKLGDTIINMYNSREQSSLLVKTSSKYGKLHKNTRNKEDGQKGSKGTSKQISSLVKISHNHQPNRHHKLNITTIFKKLNFLKNQEYHHLKTPVEPKDQLEINKNIIFYTNAVRNKSTEDRQMGRVFSPPKERFIGSMIKKRRALTSLSISQRAKHKANNLDHGKSKLRIKTSEFDQNPPKYKGMISPIFIQG